MVRQYALGLLALMIPVLCAAAQPSVPATENDKINYSVGYQIGGDFLRQGIALNEAALVAGIRAAVEQQAPSLTPAEMTDLLIQLKQRLVKEQQQQELQSVQSFMEAYRQQPGVAETASGVQYRVLQAGQGERPAATDTVSLHIRTRDINGKVISSTFEGGEPRTYRVDRLNKGLVEVVPLMQAGGKWEVVIPPGHRGGRDGEYLERIGLMIYEIELVAVQRPDSSPAAAGGPRP